MFSNDGTESVLMNTEVMVTLFIFIKKIILFFSHCAWNELVSLFGNNLPDFGKPFHMELRRVSHSRPVKVWIDAPLPR